MRLINCNYLKTFFLAILITCGNTSLAEDIKVERVYDYQHLFAGNDSLHLTEAAKYRFELNNDILVDSDNGVSNAWSFQLHSPITNNWEDIPGFTPLLKSFGAWVPGLSGEGLNKRISMSLSQLIQTPDEITNPAPIPNDVAYLGMLTVAAGFIAFNDDEFRGLNVIVGFTGEPTLAEQTQNFVHKIGGLTDVAEGWDNQVEAAPLLNIGYMYKKKFYRAGNPDEFSFDASYSGEAKIGNMITEAGLRLETRFGSNMPGGFAPHPDPIGRFMQYDARLAPPNKKAASIYGSVSLHTAAIAHMVLVDGTLIGDDPEIAGGLVEKEPFVGFLFLGFHYEKSNWAVHVQHVITTDFVKAPSAGASKDPDNTFSAIMFEWRI
jgi:hypothetical protein